MVGVSSSAVKTAAVGAAVALLLPATFALAAPATKKRPPAVALSFEQSFTPAQADPRLAAAFANRPVMASDFKFTPTASKRRPSQIRVAIRAGAATAGQAADRVRDVAQQTAASGVTLAPTTYNLGVAVGWRRFAGVDLDSIIVGFRHSCITDCNFLWTIFCRVSASQGSISGS